MKIILIRLVNGFLRLPWKKKLTVICLVFLVYLGIYLVTIPDVRPLIKTNPARTALMRQRQWEHLWKFQWYKIDQRWVSYNRISRNLRRAVLLSEDAAFFSHDGFDYDEIRAAIKTDIEKRRFARGASTITMQLSKNLYLSTSKNPLRKLKEIFITIRLEKHLTKRRIFEIYLNSIEWGNGIYGVEAASRHYFGKSASSLSVRESAMLAASIPNPRYENPQTRTRGFKRRYRTILRRMNSQGLY